MKKTLVAALAALVLTVGFTSCQEKVPSYLVVEEIDEDVYDIRGKAIVCVTDPDEVPAHVKIPNGIVAIINYAFEDCTSLKSVTIPKSVKVIDTGAFSDCEDIDVTYKGTLKDWCAGDWDDDFLENAKSVTLSDGTDLKKLTKLDAGDLKGVTRIGSGAFSYCVSLKSVTIPGSVEKIDFGAFLGCTSLESVTIPSSVTEIGSSAFSGCTSLESVIIPEGVKEIGDYAFYNCTSLESVIIPDGVTEIGKYAFYNCISLESVTIPSSVTEIGDVAFYGCPSLKEVTFGGTMEQVLNNWDNLYRKLSLGKGVIILCTDGELIVK